MDFLNLFWSFDANGSTKLIVMSVVAILILCIICKPKNKKKIDEYKTDNNNSQNLSKCQVDYKMCQENTERGNNTDKNLCHVGKPNGDYPDKVYNQNVGWVKIDPKYGNPI